MAPTRGVVEVCTQAHFANEGLLEPLFGGAEDGCRNDGRQSLDPILGALLGELLHQESREFPVLADPEALGSTEIAVADACDANRFVPETHGAEHGGLVFP
jgi:hypothetical protein